MRHWLMAQAGKLQTWVTTDVSFCTKAIQRPEEVIKIVPHLSGRGLDDDNSYKPSDSFKLLWPALFPRPYFESNSDES